MYKIDDIELLKSLFNELNKHEVEYVVLRGNLSLREMAESNDIDILVSKSHKAAFEDVVKSLGWRDRYNQWGKYPHQFYDCNSSSNKLVITLDIVDDLIFGREMYRLSKQEFVFKSSENINGVKVPNSWAALFLFSFRK